MSFNQITQAPLPELFDLLRVPFVVTPQADALSATWTRPGDSAYWFSRSAWSMAVIVRWQQSVSGTSGVTVWVPDFFCNESLALLRQMGTRLVFYPIDDRAHPAVGEFPTVTEDNRPDLFLLVHYFGEPVPCDESLAFCKAQCAWFVEDAAHVLRPIPGVGEAGDCVLYSPHKHLAIPDGAILVIRQNGPAALVAKTDGLRALDKVVDDILHGERRLDRATAFWLVKRLLQRLGLRARHKLPAFTSDAWTASKVDDPPGMSAVAKRLLGRELARMHAHTAHRVHCGTEWARVIRGVFPAEVCEVVPTSHAPPYLACVSAADHVTAKSLYARLHAADVPVSTWPDLPPEVVATAKHAAAHRLRHTRLYLPVHRSVTAGQIIACGQRLRNISLRGWRLRKITTKDEWENLWCGCRRKSLPQTWEYGSAKAEAEVWQVQRFVVLDENDLSIALFQVLIKGLPGLGGVARVNRGPLLLRADPDGSNHLALNAIAVLVRESRRRRWWMMQIAPLLPPDAEEEEALRNMGFRRQPICPMDSAVLHLEQSEKKLMAGLHGKWRNCLRKGQKLGVIVRLDEGGHEHFHRLIDFYNSQQHEKRFDGTSNRMLKALAAKQSKSFKFNLYVALDGAAATEASVVGVLVTLQFGDFSEYLIGATNEKGRIIQANSVLLWEAILEAKRNGCRWFDVGGLSERTPKGIANFKKRLNPESYALVGEWRRWF